MVSIELLDEFAGLADSGRLFSSNDKAWYYRYRLRLKKNLGELIYWHRPELERLKGIDWVYSIFRDRLALFEEYAESDDDFVKMQARLFLALLPFPRQWSWLERITADCSTEPEVKNFLRQERRIVQKKTQKKSYKKFRLRNFCQILKSPRLPLEKGVLRIFSIPYLFFGLPELLQTISNDYFLYVEPAAGITFRHTWLRLYSRLNDPVLFGLSSHEDRTFIHGQPNTITTRLAHGDYLDTRTEVPLHLKKRFDIVFNNTFDEMERKRHQLMLDLMNHPLLNRIRVLFMGRGTPGNVARFKWEIDKKGLGSRATVVANIPRRLVTEHLAQCRIGVHLSLMENGCRAVYEYLRSDLPCIMSTSTAGMDKSIINTSTGIVAMDQDLPTAIVRALENAREFTPRNWFLKNSGCINASAQLNEQLKTIFHAQGYGWHEDIVPIISSGPGRYAEPYHLKQFGPDFKKLAAQLANDPALPIHLDID
jgi:hypothetical protein